MELLVCVCVRTVALMALAAVCECVEGVFGQGKS